MKVTKRNLALSLLYLFATIAMFPILYYWVQYTIGFDVDTPDRFVKARVALSGPMLVLIGVALIFLFANRVHRGFGIMFLCGGVAWIVVIVNAFLEEFPP